MRTLLSLAFCLVAFAGFAQYGVTGQYITGQSFYSEASSSDAAMTTRISGYLAGVNYWLRLKNVRIEFFPELNYGSVTPTNPLGNQSDFKLNRWGLLLPASFYLLDFKGDCHCPTFSKQNDLFKKGFFLQLLISGHLERSQTDLAKNTQQNFGAGGGIGLDIGLSDLLTITPLFQYINHLGTTKKEASWSVKDEFRAGLRVSFRPDYR